MYEYLRCDCCKYVPDEFDMAQTDYYYLEVCHHCGRRVCPYCLIVSVATSAEELFQQFNDKDEDNRRWRARCQICSGKKENIRGFHEAFTFWRALKREDGMKVDF